MRLCFSFILAAPVDDFTLIEVLAPIRAMVDCCMRFVAFSKITPNFYLRRQRVVKYPWSSFFIDDRQPNPVPGDSATDANRPYRGSNLVPLMHNQPITLFGAFNFVNPKTPGYIHPILFAIKVTSLTVIILFDICIHSYRWGCKVLGSMFRVEKIADNAYQRNFVFIALKRPLVPKRYVGYSESG